MDESLGNWPLLHDHDHGLSVMLRAVGVAAQETAPRFVDLFRATWSRLPTAVHEDLARTWQSSEDGSAEVYLFHDLVDHAPGIGTYGIHSGPARFDFSAAKLRHMPDRLFEALIAHELAHCFLGHTGDYSTAHEVDADTLVSSWGFPMGELRVFLEPRNGT
jgi:hypothetical protein